ncbi:MAG: hypothetical protein K2L34_04915, partial [Muribaculaceae bacterium]|nr:hypothetical protein [Muribaculaceae bacterium]
GCCGVFTSCKDTNEDFINRVIGEQKDLGDRVEDLKKYTGYVEGWQQTIPDMIKANENKINDLTTKYNDLKAALDNASGSTETQINDLKSQIAGVTSQLSELLETNASLKSDLTALQATVAALEEKLKDYKPGVTEEELNTAIQGLQVILEQQINTLKTDLETVKTDVESVKTDLETVKTEVSTVSSDLAQLRTEFDADHTALLQAAADIATNAGKIEELSTSVEELTSTVDNLALEFGDLYTDINGKGGLKDEVRNLNAQITTALEKIASNEADIDNLYEVVNTNKQKINELQNLTAKYFSNINEVLNLRVSDILLNQTWNPMFGAINLPFGLTSTIAANYYGYSDHDINFPLDVNSAQYEALGNNSGLAKIGSQAIQNLLTANPNLKTVVIPAEQAYMDDAENNLGQLYLSINPTHIDTEKIKFELVNSAGEVAPIKVNVVETDEKLTFGVSRSASNGFYRANLHVGAKDSVFGIHVRVQDGLKSAMKDALTSHTKADFIQLAKVVMQQMQDILPAYGVKATWEEPGLEFPNASETVTRSYISQYNIAATAFRPLGYDFMHGQGANKDLLPTIGSIKEAFDKVFDDFNFEINTGISGINAPKFELDLSKAKLEFKATEIIVNLDGLNVNGEPVKFEDGSQKIVLTYEPDGTVSGNKGALNGLIDEIANQVNNMLAGTDDEGKLDPNSIQGQIQDGLITKVDQMVADINKQLESVNGNIQDSVDKIVANIKDTLLGKLGRVDNLVDKYNKLANKINDLLKDPNHYLQVMMAYHAANGEFGELSSDINYPTHFKSAGGDAIQLYATSYTAELIAPSYKKYVAVSRAWTKSGSEVDFNDQIGGPATANKTEFLNEVRPGSQQRFALETKNLQKGYKYEIIYSSLDYQGYTSTRTFYLVID